GVGRYWNTSATTSAPALDTSSRNSARDWRASSPGEMEARASEATPAGAGSADCDAEGVRSAERDAALRASTSAARLADGRPPKSTPTRTARSGAVSRSPIEDIREPRTIDREPVLNRSPPAGRRVTTNEFCSAIGYR